MASLKEWTDQVKIHIGLSYYEFRGWQDSICLRLLGFFSNDGDIRCVTMSLCNLNEFAKRQKQCYKLTREVGSTLTVIDHLYVYFL